MKFVSLQASDGNFVVRGGGGSTYCLSL